MYMACCVLPCSVCMWESCVHTMLMLYVSCTKREKEESGRGGDDDDDEVRCVMCA